MDTAPRTILLGPPHQRDVQFGHAGFEQLLDHLPGFVKGGHDYKGIEDQALLGHAVEDPQVQRSNAIFPVIRPGESPSSSTRCSRYFRAIPA